jgi:hypothetical protein
MAKEKFNVGNLLPAKPAVIKSASHETAPLMDRAVETIHQAPAAGSKPVATRKISCDLPADWYKFIKRYCVDHDITMREYLLDIIEEDLKRKQPA